MTGISGKAIQELAARIVAALASCDNEEQTKFAGIVPFFEALGYEAANQRSFRAEARAGDPATPAGRADFAVYDDGTALMAVECKSCTVRLDRHTPQLARYMAALPDAGLGVLTNGLEFRFFERVQDGGAMTDDPFLVLDMRTVAAEAIDAETEQFLKLIAGDDFNADDVSQFAKRRRVTAALDRWWRQQLREPTDEFCQMVLRSQDFSRVNRKLIASYRGIIVDAFLKSLAREVAETLKNVRVDRHGAVRLPPSRRSNGIITTQREYEVFQRCLIELAQSSRDPIERTHLHQVRFQDYDEHFAVFVDKPRAGLILKYYEGFDGGDYFVFRDGQTCRDLAAIAEPLIKNYREALDRLDRRTPDAGAGSEGPDAEAEV